ncbi:MAG: hypothetical protein PVG07_07190 [Acidobacteriota bacterium]|jgi:hypothetical protein
MTLSRPFPTISRAHRAPAAVPRTTVVLATVAVALSLSLFAPAPARAGVEVRILLPQRAKIDLQGKDSVAVAPFLVVAQEGEGSPATRDVDVEREFKRFLEKLLRRRTDLRLVETGPVSFPTFDLEELLEQQELWADLGRRAQADLLVTGSLDFDIQDRSGYRTEEFVSPRDGRTYYRQVLVEQTGFEYDILLIVLDGRTGEVLYRDNFKDFQNFQSDEVDVVSGMFQNLFSLEDRILGVFTQNRVEATRLLFTDTH